MVSILNMIKKSCWCTYYNKKVYYWLKKSTLGLKNSILDKLKNVMFWKNSDLTALTNSTKTITLT